LFVVELGLSFVPPPLPPFPTFKVNEVVVVEELFALAFGTK